jgi:hypothetical protein
MRYNGKCHCGEIAFTVEGQLESATECNCSICSQSGYLHWMVDTSQVQLLTPLEKATLYVWGTRQARHWFCPKCGVAVLRTPRSNARKYSVNVRCLENVDIATLTVSQFDGRNKLKI